MKIDLSWVVAFQIVLYCIVTGLHLTLSVLRHRQQGYKLATSVLFHLVLAAVVLKFYFLPAYHDRSTDSVGILFTRALFFMPFILVGFVVCYGILRKRLKLVSFFFCYAESRIIRRAILIMTIICAAIDLLFTQVFVDDGPIIIIFQLIPRALYAMVMWNVAYLTLVVCLLNRSRERKNRADNTRGEMQQIVIPPLPPNDNPYSYH